MLDQRPSSTPSRAPAAEATHQRARGAAHVALSHAARPGGATRLARLRQEGCGKAMLPRVAGDPEIVFLNTSGGLTGGDRLDYRLDVAAGGRAVATTQTAERAYAATPGATPARLDVTLSAGAGAELHWLPQETILFQNGSLRRSLTLDMTGEGRALIVEPVLIGRLAMGEIVSNAHLTDSLTIKRDGELIFKDATHLGGNISATLDKPAIGNGARAMALVVFAAPEAEAHLDLIRAMLPPTAGVSLVQDGLLVLRALAPDGFELRRTLIPILDRLSGDTLPRSWRL